MRTPVLLLLTGALASAGVSLHAQSLADVAKQEADRRKDVKSTAKVYTNKDLREVPAPPRSSADASKLPDRPDAAALGSTADVAQPAAAQPAPEEARTVAKDRTYWNKRMQDSRDQLDRERTIADALQTRINALTADVVNRDDPAQRSKISGDRMKALAELDRVKQALDADQKAMAALEDEARRAGVPPGWLR